MFFDFNLIIGVHFVRHACLLSDKQILSPYCSYKGVMYSRRGRIFNLYIATSGLFFLLTHLFEKL
jgi:hypothetical protein